MKRSPLSRQAWQWLGRELDRWTETGVRASFWWRDDDATEPGAALEKLLQISATRHIPLALAVIPAAARPALAACLADRSLVTVLQHGYAHGNHAAAGQRKLELGGTRTIDEIIEELELGRQVLTRQFGSRFVPALVPPWNRIDADVVETLPQLGFHGISTMKARRTAHPFNDLLQVNTHLDPINWRYHGGFLGIYPSIAILVQHLIARRNGYRDFDEPTGILSHHLVQNDATWTFLEDLLQFLDAHPAAAFVGADDIWLR